MSECSFEACRHRDGFGDVTHDAPLSSFVDGEFIQPFVCPAHGEVYEFVYTLSGVSRPDTEGLIHEY